MVAPTKTWKDAERKILNFWGAKRRGAHTGSGVSGSGMPDNDDNLVGWSIEIKHSKRPTFGLMVSAIEQARINRQKGNDIPVAVIHKERTEYPDSLVIMKLSDFQDFFINQSGEKGDV